MNDLQHEPCNDYDAIYGEDDAAHEGKPHGWIQWKGTRPCIDLHCSCGAHGHIDASYFFYHYKCVACGQKYALGQCIRLIPLTPEQVAKIERERPGGEGCFLFDEELLDEQRAV